MFNYCNFFIFNDQNIIMRIENTLSNYRKCRIRKMYYRNDKNIPKVLVCKFWVFLFDNFKLIIIK